LEVTVNDTGEVNRPVAVSSSLLTDVSILCLGEIVLFDCADVDNLDLPTVDFVAAVDEIEDFGATLVGFVTLTLYGVLTLVAAAFARRSTNTGFLGLVVAAVVVDLELATAAVAAFVVVDGVTTFRVTGSNGFHPVLSCTVTGFGFTDAFIEATRGSGFVLPLTVVPAGGFALVVLGVIVDFAL
jgi:hypothetical protein